MHHLQSKCHHDTRKSLIGLGTSLPQDPFV